MFFSIVDIVIEMQGTVISDPTLLW